MGMFDTIQITLQCPKCSCEIDSVQTKDLDKTLSVFKVGNSIGTTKLRYLSCWATCDNCSTKPAVCDKCGMTNNQHYYVFPVKVEISELGDITGKVQTFLRDHE